MAYQIFCPKTRLPSQKNPTTATAVNAVKKRHNKQTSAMQSQYTHNNRSGAAIDQLYISNGQGERLRNKYAND